ncbi:P-loop containing nucleoside triphosphate hydrolase protein, partial [Dimargaris cristalligena]
MSLPNGSKKRPRPRESTGSEKAGADSSPRSANHHKIKILCRVRPFLPQEQADDCIVTADRTIKIVNQRNPDEVFMYHFDACYAATANQCDIFQRNVRPLVDEAYQGLDATIFCYGVTGAGKTHTIQGDNSNPGLIPRTIEYLFANRKMRNKLKYVVSFTYFEIYKEAVFDLLVPRETQNSSGLPIREDANHNIFVPNLTEQSISSYAEFQKYFATACKNRSTASTKLNVASSRSHAVLTVQIHWDDPLKNTTLRGRVHLIDLAGSEDNRRTENGKDRMAESGAINKSLFVLGQVVEALNSGAHRIPYRDSKMTRILQSSLGGRSLGMMIVNVAPGQKFFVDTYNTLNFATKSKQIVNKTQVHE